MCGAILFSSKARAANRKELLDKLIEASHPSEMKMCGDKIKPGPLPWNCLDEMKMALDAKFDQNASLREYLGKTGEAKLCEVSSNPYCGIVIYIKSRDLYNTNKCYFNITF